jgi:hypothetical protein
MTELEKAIYNVLVEIEETGRQMRAAGLEPDLGPLLSGVDAISKKLPQETNPELLKHLRAKDYHQARIFLKGIKEKAKPRKHV